MVEWELEWRGLKFTGHVYDTTNVERFKKLAIGPIMDSVNDYLNQRIVNFIPNDVVLFNDAGEWANPYMQAQMQMYPEGVCQWVVGNPTLAVWGQSAKPGDAFRKVTYWHDGRTELVYRLREIEKGLL